VRLSYASEHAEHAEVARADASALLGLELEAGSVVDFARVQWRRPALQQHTPTGISLAGETASGTGLASIVAHSRKLAARLLQDFER